MRKFIPSVLVSAMLAACGGGGGGVDGTARIIPSSIEGDFEGSTSNGKTVDILVLEDNSFWVLYGVSSSGYLAVEGFITGMGTISNGSFSSTAYDFPAPGSSVVSATVSGSYTSTTLDGTITENASAITFTSTEGASAYTYDTAATLSDVSGSWSGSLLDGETATITVSASGAIAGTPTSFPGCSFTGLVTPRASGKNVFDVRIFFGTSSSCVLPGQTATGIGVVYPLAGGSHQLIVGVTDSTHTHASAFFAQR